MVLLIGLITAAAGRASADPLSGGSIIRVHVVRPTALQTAAPIVNVTPAEVSLATRTIVLTAAPLATFAGMTAGTFDIVVTVPGGGRAETRLQVQPNELVTLTATIAAGAGASRLEVTDRHRVAEDVVIDDRFLRDLPSTSHASSLIETVAPFVIVDQMDNGGLTASHTTFMGSRGASFTSTAMTVGRRPLADVGRVGLIAGTPDLGAIDAVVVTHGMAPVDVAAPGTHVTFVPRLPGAAWRGSARTSFTTSDMVATNALSDAPSIARLDYWREAGAVIGGPVRSNVGGLLAISATRTRQRHRDEPQLLRGATTAFVGRAVVRPSPIDQLRMSAGGARLSRPFGDRAQLADDDVQERVNEWHAGAEWERAGLSGMFVAMSADVQQHTFRPAIRSAEGGVVDRVLDGVVPEPPALHRSTQWAVQADARPRALAAGRMQHSLRIGAALKRAAIDATVLALPVVAQTVGGLPARVWTPVVAAPDAARTLTQTAVFLDDRIDLSPTLTVVAGTRFEIASGSARGAERGVAWRTISPRAAFRWRLGALVAFGGAGRYTSDLHPFLLAYGDPGAPWSHVHRWTDPNLNGRFDDGEAGALVARAGPGAQVSSVDPGLDAPRTTEWTAGGELAIGRHHQLRGVIVIRRQRSLLGLVNAGVPRSSYDEILIPDQNADWHSPNDDHLLRILDRRPESFGQDSLVLTNPEGATSDHDGIEVSWEFRSARWRMLFGATAYRSIGRGANAGFGAVENDQGLVGEQFATPNASVADAGRLFFDRAYVGKWAVSYHAARDIRIAAVARYQDGQPFSRVIIAELSTGPEMIQAYAVGRTRFTYTATVDARIEKGFRLAGRRAAVQVDVFNLTNHGNEVEEDVLTRATFRRSTAVQPPLTARLGFRVEF